MGTTTNSTPFQQNYYHFFSMWRLNNQYNKAQRKLEKLEVHLTDRSKLSLAVSRNAPLDNRLKGGWTLFRKLLPELILLDRSIIESVNDVTGNSDEMFMERSGTSEIPVDILIDCWEFSWADDDVKASNIFYYSDRIAQ